jgi:hypothetical protein
MLSYCPVSAAFTSEVTKIWQVDEFRIRLTITSFSFILSTSADIILASFKTTYADLRPKRAPYPGRAKRLRPAY